MLFARISRLRNTISLRIGFLFCFTFAIGITLAFSVTYFALRHSLIKSDHESIFVKFQEIKAALIADGPSELNTFLSHDQKELRNAQYMFRVLDDNKKILYFKPPILEKEFDFKKGFNSKPHLGWESIPAVDDEDNFEYYTEKVGTKYYLQVGQSSEDRDGLLEEVLITFGFLEFVLIIFSLILGVWYARKSLAPLRDLLTSMRSVEKGNLSQRLNVFSSNDELQDMGEAFNRMVIRIEKLVLVMRESLDNVSHDIRTPLTRIRAVAADALVSEDPRLLKSSLEDCAESAANISELVDQLLSISEAEAGTLSLNYKSIDIKNLLEEVAEIYEYVALEKNIQIIIDTTPSTLNWNLDQKRIKQVIANLIDNSIKFSLNGTKITMKAFQLGPLLKIIVEDEGPGIAIEEIERIWERLYRGDKSRSTQGLGLGLSIVRAIVSAHEGSTLAFNRSPTGMIFEISLPSK